MRPGAWNLGMRLLTHLSFTIHTHTCRNVITAFWFISQALGTLLNAGVAQIPMSLSYEFFIYMVMMFIVTGIFVFINRNFRYRNNS